MHLTIFLRSILAVAVAAVLFSSCKSSTTGDAANAAPAEASKTESPFANKEPEKYQAEIWQTSAKGTEKFLITRDGAKWRIDSAYGSPEQVSTIHTDKDYVIAFAAKSYGEYPIGHGFDERERTVNEVSLGLLNSLAKGTFEKLGTEGGVTRYKVVSDADKGKASIISFDEKIALPVKKEIFGGGTPDGTPEMTVTLSGFKTDFDAAQFALPKDVKKASFEEMKKILSGIK
jgi:hypothetical protein